MTLARITAAADFPDALMEARSSKSGMRLEAAVRIIRRRGGLYDPDAMNALFRILDAAVPELNLDYASLYGRRAG